MATRLKAGMVVAVDFVTTSEHGCPATLIRFHKGGWVMEVGGHRGCGWVCQFDDGQFQVYERRFLAVNRYYEKGGGPPDPHRHDWYFNSFPAKAKHEQAATAGQAAPAGEVAAA